MPECQCWTKYFKLAETDDGGLNILSAFRHPWYLSVSMSHVHVHTACPCPCVWVCIYVCMFMWVCVCINAGLSGIWSVWYQNEKTNDAEASPVPDQADEVQNFFGPVPDWNYECQKASAGVSLLNADAQLWKSLNVLFENSPIHMTGDQSRTILLIFFKWRGCHVLLKLMGALERTGWCILVVDCPSTQCKLYFLSDGLPAVVEWAAGFLDVFRR